MKTMRILEKARCLRELAEKYGLHGLYFQHAALCRRRAWLHLMGATHAVRHARVQRGLALHEVEKRPGEAPKGLGITPDAIDFEAGGDRKKGRRRSTRCCFPPSAVLRRVHDRRHR